MCAISYLFRKKDDPLLGFLKNIDDFSITTVAGYTILLDCQRVMGGSSQRPRGRKLRTASLLVEEYRLVYFVVSYHSLVVEK